VSAAQARKTSLVTKPIGAIDADMAAFTIMDHIDTMYPAMWLAVPKCARVSVRNTIVNAVLREDARR
jgi:hypothetical protein